MNLTESFKIAIKAIRANWMRSLLTMLGIIIGIGSVIMIIGAGDGAKDFIVSMIEEMGSNAVLISVDTTSAEDSDYITLDDVDAIKEKVNGVESCSPFMMDFATGMVPETETQAMAILMGGNADIQYAMTSDFEYGRFFNEDEYNAGHAVAVIGSSSAQEIFGYKDVVGEYIELSGAERTMKVKIIGVANIEGMASSGGDSSSMMSMFGGDSMSTMMLFLPATTMQELTGTGDQVSSIYVMTEDVSQLDAVGNATHNFLIARHNNADRDVYSVQNMATYIDMIDSIISIMTQFIAAVAAISLVVGGIGVMNIMLVSVTERTREIGIRKALGARTSHLTTQFLTESVIICLIGGVIGIVLGISGAYVACRIMGIDPQLTVGTVLMAMGFSSAVGLFFGIYPARRAAKMNPIDALRRE
ncbi:MAG: ABC transporter permease [Clostridiales bacterium]|nr:ABC transporter permease [Clostridiales bacterium]